ncbi:MAG: DUF1236 domain-containing protein [Xanthobacteraceae bacterium]|nr:DUF1236 domain-containing protein [Xanthobacteraceae bacterium]
MRRNLSITTAAAALLVGTVFAAAQGVQRPGGAEQGQGGTQMAPQQDGGKGKAQNQKEPRTQGQGGQTQGQQGQAAPEPKGKAQSKEPSRAPGQNGQGQRDMQGPRDEQPKQQQSQPKQQPPQQQQGQQSPRDTEKTQKGAEGKGGTQTSGNVTLTTEQRTTIRTTVLQSSNAPRVTNVNFSLNVGTVVPRDRVKLVAVPATLVEIHPAWRGYLYFIVDERIIIVEPASYKIVAVLVV